MSRSAARGRLLPALAACALLAACWTGPDPAPAPKYAVGARHRTPPHTVPKPTSSELAQELASLLRTYGRETLIRAVDGPVVVLDADAMSFQTLCGENAERAAGTWAAQLGDAGRLRPLCAPGADQHFACSQQFLSFDFIHDELGFRLMSVVVGLPSSGSRMSLRHKLQELQAQVATATCP